MPKVLAQAGLSLEAFKVSSSFDMLKMESTHRHWFGLVILLTVFQFDSSLADQGKVISAGFRFSNAPFQFKGIELGETFVFDCTTNGNNVKSSLYFQTPSSYPKWNRITKDTPDVTVNGGVYTIANVGIPEAGYYRCEATNGSGQTIVWPQGYGLLIPFTLKTPAISVYPNHLVHLSEGQSQNFTCESGSTITKLTWYRTFIKNRLDLINPIPISKTVIVRDTTKNLVKNILMFKNAQVSDSGMFKCVSNFRGKQRVKFAALRVHEILPPVILSHTSSVDVGSPQNAKLECAIEGHPRPNITWYKGIKEITIPGCNLNRIWSCQGTEHSMWIKRSVQHEQYHAILIIRKSEYPSDHGVYRCEASTNRGTAKADIFVNVQGKPVFDKAFSTTIYGGQVKSPYIVSCGLTTQSNPPATFTWELQPFWELSKKPHPNFWIPLTSGHTFRSAKYKMTSTVVVPRYIIRAFYRCTAINVAGKDTHIIKYIRHI